jgi:branched-chain amino acid transport system substrate-binding protein
LQPGDVFFRAGDHQLISTIFVGQVHPPRGGEYNVFTVAQQVPGAQAAGPVTETGCRLTYPS